jgi:hypothetical protein
MAPNGGFGFKVKKRRPRGTKWQFAWQYATYTVYTRVLDVDHVEQDGGQRAIILYCHGGDHTVHGDGRTIYGDSSVVLDGGRVTHDGGHVVQAGGRNVSVWDTMLFVSKELVNLFLTLTASAASLSSSAASSLWRRTSVLSAGATASFSAPTPVSRSRPFRSPAIQYGLLSVYPLPKLHNSSQTRQP